MNKIFLIIVFVTLAGGFASAQKFGFVDTDYILKNMPSYSAAQEQLNQTSKKYQEEVESKFSEIQAAYKAYQNESVFLSPELKVKRENEIVEKEKIAKALQQKYFGAEGDLFKKRQTLIKPIQDQIYNAVKELAKDETLSALFDKSSGSMGIIFADPKLDRSDAILSKLGIKK